MKYFTPELYVALQNLDDQATFDAANKAWQQAVEQYDHHLDRIGAQLPSSLQELFKRCHLHDADVLIVKQSGDMLVIEVQLDTPPQDIVELTYFLHGDPEVLPVTLPVEYCSDQPEWMYDEIDMDLSGRPNQSPVFIHSVQLSNGYQLQFRFTSVEVRRSRAILPPSRSPGSAIAISSAAG